MNKLNVLIISFIFFSLVVKAQNDKADSIENWKNNSDYCEFLNKDLSSVFMYESCSYLGIFGNNKYKINIRFDLVEQKNNNIYKVLGRSLLKEKKCDFIGELNVESVELHSYSDYNHRICLVAKGSYNFTESDKKGGMFSGKFRKYFYYYLQNDSISVDLDFEVSSREGYAGSWKSATSEKDYPCHFGFFRYPGFLAGDFDQGGEPNIDPKYKAFGWEKYFKQRGDYGSYSNTDCIDKWWLEK